MKILIVTGSYPPETCGVGDYTYNLFNCVAARASKWMLYTSRNWKLKSICKTIREIKAFSADVIFMQSPTMGYGWSLVPHIVTAFFSCCTPIKYAVVLHEFTQLSFKARLAASIMLLTANHVVFTNETDRQSAIHYFRRLRKRSSVVKIFSNIQKVPKPKTTDQRRFDLVNFGHIRPGKGIEVFLQAVQEIRSQAIPAQVILVGQVPKGYEPYYEQIAEMCARLSVPIRLNLSDEEVASILNDSKIAYLPFPDGISERRGSFLAAATNGVIVLSNAGRFPYEALRQSVVITSPECAARNIIRILSLPAERQVELQRKSLRFLSEYMPHSWDEIATAYNNIASNLTK